MAKKFFELIQDKSQQTDGSGPALFNLFNKRVKENLHIIFAMSPLSPEFKSFIASKCLNLKRFADISFQPTACRSPALVFHQQKEVARPKARLKPTLPK